VEENLVKLNLYGLQAVDQDAGEFGVMEFALEEGENDMLMLNAQVSMEYVDEMLLYALRRQSLVWNGGGITTLKARSSKFGEVCCVGERRGYRFVD